MNKTGSALGSIVISNTSSYAVGGYFGFCWNSSGCHKFRQEWQRSKPTASLALMPWCIWNLFSIILLIGDILSSTHCGKVGRWAMQLVWIVDREMWDAISNDIVIGGDMVGMNFHFVIDHAAEIPFLNFFAPLTIQAPESTLLVIIRIDGNGSDTFVWWTECHQSSNLIEDKSHVLQGINTKSAVGLDLCHSCLNFYQPLESQSTLPQYMRKC